MNKVDFNEVYGYYLLCSEGLVVYNPQYVARYGSFMRCLARLRYKPMTPTRAYLKESYANSAASAKFFATYPKDLSGFSLKEMRSIRAEVVYNSVNHRKRQA